MRQPGDPYTAPAPARPFAAEVGVDPGRLRIGFRTGSATPERRTPTGGPPRCERPPSSSKSLGHVVEPAPLPALDAPGFGEAVGRDDARVDRPRARPVGGSASAAALGADDIEPWNATLGRGGPVPSRRRCTSPPWSRRSGGSRGVAAWWTDHDLLLTPTVTAPTPPLGYIGPPAELADMFSRMGTLVGFSMPFNVTGQPAISLPLTHDPEGLPVGVQLVGAYGREDVLLRVASQLEAACPWRDRRPPVAAA